MTNVGTMSENERLAERLTTIASALRPKANGSGGGLRIDDPAVLDALAQGLWNFLGPRFGEINKRIAELEARPTMKYVGVWRPEKTYVVGNVVTDDGSLWHAERSSIGMRPGDGSDNWTLCVKRGRDAKGSK